MGSPWTDTSAILRDLSFAQGRWVPGGIESAVAGAMPPAHNVEEDTEEEYFRCWTMLESGGTGDFSAGPDLCRIRKMLELMQDEEAPNEEILSGPIEISKLNPSAPPFLSKENIDPYPRKPRKARNVAIASIMALASEFSQEPPKLVKPEDSIKPSKEDVEMKEIREDSVNKVTNWLPFRDITSMFKKKSVKSFKEKQSLKNVEPLSKSPVSLQSQDITSMFKKKSVNSFKEKQSLKNVEPLSKSPESELSVKSPNRYTPTPWADEYYRKIMDRTRMRDLVREDVWGRAERAMKEIDTKKEELKLVPLFSKPQLDDGNHEELRELLKYIRKKEAAAEYEAELVRQCTVGKATETAGEGAETADEAAEIADEAAEIADEAAEIAGEAAETADEAAMIAGEAPETADEAAGPVENAESEGIAHILLPLSRHALYPGAECVVCRVLGGRRGGRGQQRGGEDSREGM